MAATMARSGKYSTGGEEMAPILANSTPFGKEMAPTEKGANDRKGNSPRSGAVKNLSLRRGGPPSEPGVLVGAKFWRRRWRTLGGLHAQRRGDGAHGDGLQGRGGELPTQQRGKEPLPEEGRGVPPAEPGVVIGARLG